MKYYLENNYGDHDPVRKLARTNTSPFTWKSAFSNFKKFSIEKRIYNEANEAKLYNGIGIPLQGKFGALAGVGAASSDPRHLPNEFETELVHLATMQFYKKFCQLAEKDIPLDSPQSLSLKERIVLSTAAKGLTQKEVARKLCISVHTVDYHIRNVSKKLQTPNLVASVAKAMSLGLITI